MVSQLSAINPFTAAHWNEEKLPEFSICLSEFLCNCGLFSFLIFLCVCPFWRFLKPIPFLLKLKNKTKNTSSNNYKKTKQNRQLWQQFWFLWLKSSLLVVLPRLVPHHWLEKAEVAPLCADLLVMTTPTSFLTFRPNLLPHIVYFCGNKRRC